MDDILLRAAERRAKALAILSELQLIERWGTIGQPIIVGAVAHELVVAPDIDMEIFCADPSISEGFAILNACALHPRIKKAQFANMLDTPDQGLYWQLRYLDDDKQLWKIDMWSMRPDNPSPYAAKLVEPMRAALTPETRIAILAIKEQLRNHPELQCASINIYRAVLDDGVRDLAQFRGWLAKHQSNELTAWQPRVMR